MGYRKRWYSPGQLRFVTASTYRRAPLFLSETFRRCFVETLAEVRQATKSMLIGWVLMPDHFHLLLKPGGTKTTSVIVQRLKGQSATKILKRLRDNQQNAWCRKMLAAVRLPPSVHDESHYRAWQRRFYPFNIYSHGMSFMPWVCRHRPAKCPRHNVGAMATCSTVCDCVSAF